MRTDEQGYEICCYWCLHWEPVGKRDGASEGTCQRYAPRPSEDQHYPQWPRTNQDDHCGEFKRNPALKVEEDE